MEDREKGMEPPITGLRTRSYKRVSFAGWVKHERGEIHINESDDIWRNKKQPIIYGRIFRFWRQYYQ